VLRANRLPGRRALPENTAAVQPVSLRYLRSSIGGCAKAGYEPVLRQRNPRGVGDREPNWPQFGHDARVDVLDPLNTMRLRVVQPNDVPSPELPRRDLVYRHVHSVGGGRSTSAQSLRDRLLSVTDERTATSEITAVPGAPAPCLEVANLSAAKDRSCASHDQDQCNYHADVTRRKCANLGPLVPRGRVTGWLLRRGFLLEYATLAWNVVGIVVLAVAAVAARSVALAGSAWTP
jgi:hypothetical protein